MKRVLLRLDLNVPIQGGRIVDDFRIRAALPTIRELLRKGAQVFIITHLEEDDATPHLDVVHRALERLLKHKIQFIRGTIPAKSKHLNGRIILFDNIRLNKGEKTNDLVFARRLASCGDYFINDAFSASHRAHASIVGIPKLLPSALGPLMEREMKELSRALRPQHPFLFVLGGKKFSTKEPLARAFLKKADTVAMVGALANTFLAERGVLVGKSAVEKEKIPHAILWHKKIVLPSDAVVLRGDKKKTVSLNEITPSDVIFDAGPKTTNKLAALAQKSRLILWNGPLGLYEKGFAQGTRDFAKALGKSKAYKIVGGGDTIAVIRALSLEKNFDFISTGGGAMLEFLAHGTLTGIEVVKNLSK